MERCPVCRATLTNSSTCRRCGCELSSVKATEDKAIALLQLSVTALVAGEREHAASLAATAVSLRRTPLTTALLGFTNWYPAEDNSQDSIDIIEEEEDLNLHSATDEISLNEIGPSYLIETEHQNLRSVTEEMQADEIVPLNLIEAAHQNLRSATEEMQLDEIAPSNLIEEDTNGSGSAEHSAPSSIGWPIPMRFFEVL